jgi:3-oxoacyl-[acyl-carrier protein] reductase
MLLEDENAVIYRGGGSIGGAVARAFAHEGANVVLAGRTLTRLQEVAEEIRSTGGVAETAQVDALDEQAVDQHADAVAASAGGIDVSFNLITYQELVTRRFQSTKQLELRFRAVLAESSVRRLELSRS